MDRETLYLDNDEEITSVVDKLKSAANQEIDLVIPKEALLLQSVVNLKLLKRQAESLGKGITIVTQDKVGRKLAEQIGIPVIEKVGQVPKEVKMSEVDEGHHFSEDDIQLKEGKEEVVPEAIVPTEEVVEEVAEKKTVESEPAESSPETTIQKGKKEKKKWGKWKKYGLVGGFAALALLIAGYIFIPLANVSMRIAAEKQRVDVSFKADQNIKEVDTSGQIIPATMITEEKEVSKKYPATGKKKVGEKATGSVKIYNKEDNKAHTLYAGSKLVAPGGLVYTIKSNIQVPAAGVGGGQVIATPSAEVAAEADQVGSSYNATQTLTMTVPALTGNFYAQNSGAFSGGSSRDVTFVTQADINAAKTDMTKSAENEIRTAIAKEIKDGENLIEKAVELKELSATPSVSVNGEASEFELRAKYSAKAIVFKEDDLKKLAEKVLAEQIGSTKEIVESDSLISSTEFVDGDFEKGTMNARLSGEAYIATKIDEAKLRLDLSAEKEAKAKQILSELGGIEDVNIRFFPSFYKRMPRIKSHIYIKTEISKSQSDSSESSSEATPVTEN